MKSNVLQWGFLSTSRINDSLLEPLRTSKRNHLLAVGSREKSKAEKYAVSNNVERYYGSYERLLNDTDIDVVYIAVPNHLHAEWTLKALEAGKNVLCEKPLALSLRDVDAIAEARFKHGKVVAEGFMYRTHEQTMLVKEIVRNGKLGTIRTIRSSFTYMLTDKKDYRWNREMGGGSLWDVGCYCIDFARTVLADEPLEVSGSQVTGATGVDESFVARLCFPNNVSLEFNCGIREPFKSFVEIIGHEATLRVPNPFIPGMGEKILIARNEKTEIISIEGTPQYVREVEDMADAIFIGKSPTVDMDGSRANVAAILSLFESAKIQRPVKIA